MRSGRRKSKDEPGSFGARKPVEGKGRRSRSSEPGKSRSFSLRSRSVGRAAPPGPAAAQHPASPGEVCYAVRGSSATHGDDVLPSLAPGDARPADELDRLGGGLSAGCLDAEEDFGGLFAHVSAAEEKASGKHLASFFEGTPVKRPPPKPAAPPPPALTSPTVASFFDGKPPAPAPAKPKAEKVPLRRVEDKRLVFASATLGFTLALFQAAWKSTAGLGRPHQTLKFSSSVKSKSIRLIVGRIDGSHRVLEARPKSSAQSVQ